MMAGAGPPPYDVSHGAVVWWGLASRRDVDTASRRIETAARLPSKSMGPAAVIGVGESPVQDGGDAVGSTAVINPALICR